MILHARTSWAKTSGTLMVLALCLSACATARQPAPASPYASVPHGVVVTFEKRTLAVHYAPGAESPDASQIAALNVLFAMGDLGRGDVVVIERSPSQLAQARAMALLSGLSREGLVVSLAVSASVSDGELRLQIEHAVATAPDCPNWTKPPGDDFDNTLHSDFGCATAMNLAAMVANPRDLLAGHAMGGVVGDAALVAMHTYRKGKAIDSGSSSAAPGAATFTVTPGASTTQ